MPKRPTSSRRRPPRTKLARGTILDLINLCLVPFYLRPAPGESTRYLETPELRVAHQRFVRSIAPHKAKIAALPADQSGALLVELGRKASAFAQRTMVRIPSVPSPRLELWGPNGPLLDQHGTIFRARPGRSLFAYGETKEAGRPRKDLTAVAKIVEPMLRSGLSHEKAAKRLKRLAEEREDPTLKRSAATLRRHFAT